MARDGSQTRLMRGRAIAARGDAIPPSGQHARRPSGLAARHAPCLHGAGGRRPVGGGTECHLAERAHVGRFQHCGELDPERGADRHGVLRRLEHHRPVVRGRHFDRRLDVQPRAASAAGYTFDTRGSNLTFTGVGIQGGTTTISNTGTLSFSGTSTAGSATS